MVKKNQIFCLTVVSLFIFLVAGKPAMATLTFSVHDAFFGQSGSMAMDRFAGVGDQGWINMYRPSMDYFQDFFPNEVVSYKAHCVGNNNKVTVPKKAKIICFHGRPRPHEITDGLSKYWKQ